jgi:hypothetical protein
MAPLRSSQISLDFPRQGSLAVVVIAAADAAVCPARLTGGAVGGGSEALPDKETLTMAITLNDLQQRLLSAANGRKDGSLFPSPRTMTADADQMKGAVASLIRRKLAARAGDRVTITDAGRAAIGNINGAASDPGASSPANAAMTSMKADKVSAVKDGGASPGKASASSNGSRSPSARAGSKTALLIDLLAGGGGATLADLTSATGWLPHTVRAALTGLRKKGHAISRSRQEGHSRYYLGA